MRDEDENTYIKQPDERSVGAVEWAPEVPQPPRRGRRSRAHMACNLEFMAEQMLEMQRQQATQIASLMPAYNKDSYPLLHLCIRLTSPRATRTNARVKKRRNLTHMPR
ncbi:hypothetical protein Fot_21778 [Forsythia ovata]|uniref:Uncharacterized protein n=1 Tax=Forsythia ovata TaxID=205694 RepID=A0ABD1UW29_9LAMI